MKIFLVFIFSITVFLMNATAATTKNTAVATTSATKGEADYKTTNSKTHDFEDLLINGKYHFSDEAVSTVEADKVFDSLIGVRNDFKDRLEDSSTNK